MMSFIKQVKEWLWGTADKALSTPHRLLRNVARVLARVIDDIARGDLQLYAMSLVYTTLLSIVPVLAVAFSVLKGFGVHNQLEPALLQFLEPLGEKGVELASRIIEFVDNINVGVLGTLGLGLLVYTVISLMHKIEHSLNAIWHVGDARSFARRFSDYLSVLLVGPVLVFSALGLTGTITNSTAMRWLAAHEPAHTIITAAGQLIPYLLIVIAFAFIYIIVPNTKVRVSAALVGAAIAGVLWELVGTGFAMFIASSTKYTAIYSSFAIVLIAMIWLYLAWLILLIGSSVAFYHQYPERLNPAYGQALSPRALETSTLALMVAVGIAHRRATEDVGTVALSERLNIRLEQTEDLLRRLVDAGLVARADDATDRYLPAVDPEQVTVTDILAAVRSSGDEAPVSLEDPALREADAVMTEIERAAAERLAGKSWRDLIAAADSPPQQDISVVN
jgi:membrane protein